jgi:MFS superfamily sulfate permease-like transporter
MSETAPGPRHRIASLLREANGALGDIGTLLPYAIGAVAGGVLLPGPVFAGFAAGYLMVALVYGLPVAVQPMKALGASVLTGALATAEIAWAGAMLGGVLLAIAASPAFGRLLRAVPQTIVVGLQCGLGLALGLVAFRMIAGDWIVGLGAAAMLALSLVVPRVPWLLLVVGIAFLTGSAAPGPEIPPPAGSTDLLRAIGLGVVPQLPLTLLNAVVVTAAVARSLYGPRAARISERRLAITTGALNLALAPLGALPMCHGSAGVAAHHRFGARTAAAPLLMAALCAAAALAGPVAIDLVARIPVPVLGALLLYAAADLAFSRRLVDARPDCRPVIGVTAAGTALGGPIAGLACGVAAEWVRLHITGSRRTE